MGWGVENAVPFQLMALPVSVTTTQKVGDAHETAGAGPPPAVEWSIDHEPPCQTRTSPSSSSAAQKLADAQDTAVIPSLGSGQRIFELTDHDVPSQRAALPDGEPAAQNVGVGHETWLR